jgi:uncharacterized protein
MDENTNLPGSENDPDKDPEGSGEDNNDHRLHQEDFIEVPVEKTITPVIPPVTAAFIGLIGGFFLYQIVGGLLTFIVLGFDIENAPVNGVRLMTAAGQILFILLPALLFSKWFYEDVSRIIRFNPATIKETGLFLIGIVVLTPLLQNYLYIQNHYFEYFAEISPFFEWLKSTFDSLNELIEKTFGNLLAVNNFAEGLLVIFVIAVVPSVCEEVMFRGFIQRSFEFKLKPFSAALVTAVFFGLYHFNPYGIIPLIVLGLYFGWAAYMSNSIMVPIVLHFFNNFTAVMIYIILGDDELISSSGDTTADLTSSLLAVIFLLVLFFGIIFYIKRYYREKKTN